MKKSVLDVRVSCFANYREARFPKPVNLITWLTSDKYREKVGEIRKIGDKVRRDEIKATLPAITPSGEFSQRCESGLVNHSGLIQIDLDRQDNLHICNWEEVKSELTKLPELAYLGRSVSGTGYWGLIPIPADFSKHKLYFEAIEKAFEQWGIQLDTKPKNVASLRGYSFDVDGYFNHDALIFSRTIKASANPPKGRIQMEPSYLFSWLLEKMNQAAPGQRHSTRLKIGRLIGGYIASGILPSDAGDFFIEDYLNHFGAIDSLSIQKKEINAIKHGIINGMNSPIA